MASIYPRAGSRFFWIRFRGADGKYQGISSGIDVALPGARKKAKIMAAKYTIKELSAPKIRESERWESWALNYLTRRYSATGSWSNVELAFRDLLAFFAAFNIKMPRQVTYQVAAEFVSWRMAAKDMSKISMNSARLRFVYFSVLMKEAVNRGYAEFNPCRDVKNRRTPPKEKQEITAEHQVIIEAALKSRLEWMQDQWLVMMRQGCRIAETSVPLERIDTEQMTIELKLKGGRMHSARLHRDLLPLVAKVRERGDTHLVRLGSHGDATRWCEFFKKLKLPYSSHCCRVTVITRLLRANYTPALVASFIGHSEEINRIYRRLKPVDSRDMLDTLAAAPSPS